MPALSILCIGGGAGIGTSTMAAALGDALARQGHKTAVFEVCPPYRSSYLAQPDSGAIAPGGHETSRLRVTRRPSGAQVVRLDSADKDQRVYFFDPNDVPSIEWWLAAADSPDVVVVDFGWPVGEQIESTSQQQTSLAPWLVPDQAWPTAMVVGIAPSLTSALRGEHTLNILTVNAGWKGQHLVAALGGDARQLADAAGPEAAEGLSRSNFAEFPFLEAVRVHGAASDMPPEMNEAAWPLLQAAQVAADRRYDDHSLPEL